MSTIKKHSPLFLILLFCSCYGKSERGLKEKSSIIHELNSSAFPTLVKPIGIDPYTSTCCSLRDKAGILRFGTRVAGLYSGRANSFVAGDPHLKDRPCENVTMAMPADKTCKIWCSCNRRLEPGSKNGCVTHSSAKALLRLHFPASIAPQFGIYQNIKLETIGLAP